MKKMFDSIVHLKEAGWTEEQTKAFFRRFIPIGTTEEMDKLFSLVKEKSLSREDLTLILRTITNELQDIRTILEFIRAEIGAMGVDEIMEKRAADFEKKLSQSKEKAFIAACDNLKSQYHDRKVPGATLHDSPEAT